MNLKRNLGIGAALLGSVALGATLAAFSVAQQTPAPEATDEKPFGDVETSFSDLQEDEIRAVVKNYLLNNPEVIIEAVNEYGRRQQARASIQAKDNAKANLAELLDPAHGYVAGKNPENAKVAVIELFDYHCGFCKRAAPIIKMMIEDEKDVKVVFREYPILRDESYFAAEAALASREQGKFLDMHFAMMDASGVLTKDRVEKIAKQKGVDLDKLNSAIAADPEPAAIIRTHEIAQSMGVDGTPAFIVASMGGDYINVISGFRPEDLVNAIDEARAAAK